jgi:hypothetical protein
MYAQQIPNQGYQAPIPLYPQQTPTPSQTDLLDQLSKVIDLTDKLRGRESNGNAAPGSTSVASQSVGSAFNERPQEQLAIQELLLRNPSLLGLLQQQSQQNQLNQQQQVQQPQQQIQQQVGSLNLNPQQTEQLKQNIQTIDNCARQFHNQLQQTWQLNHQIMTVFNRVCEYAQELEKIAAVAQTTNNLSNTFLQEKNALQDLVGVQQQMLTNPNYLLHHAFGTWDANIGLNQEVLDYISSLYLELVKRFEERHLQQTGQYTPRQTAYLQSQIDQQPVPQPQQGDANMINYIKSVSQSMQPAATSAGNAGLGNAWQRLQSQRFNQR